ncbi:MULTISPECIES: LD-carboxypeptidase [unclassified Photobacterium]|uniref:LD-carboxypeptidase n=1 Tax=unclassified Photobacterium TaxID=2628852 RepID=UPI000D159AAD|nr:MULTISPECIES: LD-carboxypeptidase [unclassified Photobacterium]PSV47764.1 LD-carboxypeptidase [Photobacterium sp. GB-36]PSW72540.1 LD-carboxypeptidase [Photobacterium sp. GB-50]
MNTMNNNALDSDHICAKDLNQIALISCSTQYDEQSVNNVVDTFIAHGYMVTTKYLNQVISDIGYVNTDQERANNLIAALLDPTIDVLWFFRGGGGALNLLPFLHAYKIQLQEIKPKMIVGFSDVTAIHSFINNELGWQSVHAVNASTNQATNGGNEQPIPDLKTLINDGVSYNNVLPLNDLAKSASVSGQLIGGNHTLVSATFGTHYQPDFSNKVLLLEDIGVTYRQLDRYLQQLLFLKDFDVNAIVFGQYYNMDPNDQDRLMYKHVLEQFAKQLGKPVYYFPFIGHGKYNQPVIFGRQVSLQRHELNEHGMPSDYCNLTQN